MKKEAKYEYELKRHCGNCGYLIKLNIPRGITLVKFLDNNKKLDVYSLCPYCGCNAYLERYVRSAPVYVQNLSSTTQEVLNGKD